MKKIMIVDDEYLVRLGLKTTVDWANHGFSIVGEASNGKEALSLFDKTQPDILLTDIKMPQMDGLELIEKLKARNAALQVVILTHYDDFAYAQKAISLGASQYILKSELNQANILSLLDHLSVNSHTDAAPERDQSEQMRAYLTSLMLDLHIFSGGQPAKPPALPSAGRFILFHGSCPVGGLPGDNYTNLLKSAQSIYQQTWPAADIVLAKQQETLYMLALSPFTDGAASAETFLEQALRASENIMQYFDISINGGISLPGSSGELSVMLKQAENAREKCFFSHKKCLLFSPAPRSKRMACPSLDHDLMEKYVYDHDFEGMRGYIDGVFAKLLNYGDVSSANSLFIDFLSYGKNLCTKHSMLNQPALSEQKFSYDTFLSMPDIFAAQSYILDLYQSLFQTLEGKATGYSAVISRCIAFITEHYAENIALLDVANAVEISKSYLSLLFKQETGVNFSTFLMNCRIDNAKRLLSTTNLKIYEVADQVGFSNPYYFSKVFKETTGLSCRDYKNVLHDR